MSLFAKDGDGWRHDRPRARAPGAAPATYGLPPRTAPATSTSAEPPDLGALLTKINRAARRPSQHQHEIEHVRLQRRRAAAEPDLIPDGTFAKVIMTIRPGGVDGQTEIDQGCSRRRPRRQRRAEPRLRIHRDRGPPRPRKFWHSFTVSGGKVDEKGASIGWNISKRTFRAMIDSALGLDPDDHSEEAKAKRRLRGLADLDGITFVAKIAVEPNNDPATRTRTSSTGRCCPTRKSGARS